MLRIFIIAGVMVSMMPGIAWADSPAASPKPALATAPPLPQVEPTRIQLTTPDEAKLASTMAGQIVELSFKDGDAVKKGDVLVRFLCDEQQARLAQAEAHVEEMAARLKSTSKLDSLGSASKVDVEVQKADLAGAKAEESLAMALVDHCIVKAPFDGYVANISVKAFDTVQQGQALLDLVGNTSLEIAMIVPSRWLSWLKPGHAFTIRIDETDKRYASVITRIGGHIDPITQSITVYAKVTDAAPELMAGMSGVAELSPPPEHAP